MATGPIQRAATARVEQIAGVGRKDQSPGLRGFARRDMPIFHTPGDVHRVHNAPRGKLAPPGTPNFHNHA